jgi:tetratricopeptide (TPR) repeat protein
MRHLRTSRVADRDKAAADLLRADAGLEGEPVPGTPDHGFPLRPLAASLPGEDVVTADPLGERSEVDQLLARAREQLARGRGTEAALTFRQVLEVEPGHREARVASARLLEAAGDLEAATEHLTTLLRAEPDAVDLLVQRGELLGMQKLFPDAESDLRRALKREPQHAGALHALGVVQLRKGLPTEAAPTLERALAADPSQTATAYALGEAYLALRDLRAAEQALRRTLELEPGHARACHLLGRVLDRQGRTEEAAQMYQRAREGGR